MGQNEAAKVRNRQLIAVRLGLLIGNGEQIERNAAMGVPDRLDRRQLRRLMLESVEAVRIAEEELQRHQHGQQPQRHRQHRARLVDEAPASEIRGGDADDDEAGGDVDGVHGVGEPVGKRRIEDDLAASPWAGNGRRRFRSRPASASSCWWRESRRSKTSVPRATISAATKCAHRGTRLRPNRSTPRKAASRKKAVSPS